MKKLILLFPLFFYSFLYAQVDSIPNPPGFNTQQLRTKRVIRVSPDNHIWTGYYVGATEYDGASWKYYTDTNGLPSKNVSSFAFNGSIKWIGTDNGLFKTDGINITTFNTLNSPLPSNNILDLYQSDTTLWVATDRGAVSVNGSSFTLFNTANSLLLSDTVLSINENHFGVYFSDYSGISVLTSGGWKQTAPSIRTVRRITADSLGHLFAYNYRIADTVLREVPVASDPCTYNLLFDRTYAFLGSPASDKIISASGFTSVNGSIGFEHDSLFHLTQGFSLPIELPSPASGDSINLFDFNRSGELILASYQSVRPVYKINFNGLSPLPQLDSCPYLDVNQVRARIWNNGSMFWNLTGNALYEVPKGQGKAPIFGEGLWIGGLDFTGGLRIAAQTYRQGGNDFWPGPLDTVNATIDPATFLQYNKLWKIDRNTVNDFIVHFLDGSVTNGTYTVPSIILDWPAHGSGNYSRALAPFHDFNQDGSYNPYDGDYPAMKGDQMLWWVFNDNYSVHNETNSFYNLGVEIHASAYAYDCPLITGTDSVINYTTFYHYDFINRSNNNYHDVYLGVYTDVDLGNYLDDYVGCDTSMNTAFCFNGDNDDEGPPGYGLNPPMINLSVLSGPVPDPNDGLDNNHNGVVDEPGEKCLMNHFLYFNNDFSVTGNPAMALDFYNYLRGQWKDGTPLTYWGNGYDPLSTDYTDFAFTGPLYDTTGWSESHPCPGCSPNPASDRRFIISSGPVNFPAHGKSSLDYAYVYTREPDQPNGPNTSWAVNRDQVARIKHFFETDSFPCNHVIGINEMDQENIPFTIYPNPARAELNVLISSKNPGNVKYIITDVMSRPITKGRSTSASGFRIDVSELSSGIYFLSVFNEKTRSVRKFIVE